MEHWTQERYDAFRRELYAQQEEAYRQFHTKLLRSDLPVIGLRAPLLRTIATLRWLLRLLEKANQGT